jgi:hypothetical protein
MATERVLLYRLGSLGDMVVALPALHLVARTFPDAERRLLTNDPVSAKAAPAEAVLGGATHWARAMCGSWRGCGGRYGAGGRRCWCTWLERAAWLRRDAMPGSFACVVCGVW